jgi:hypothetical protein
VPQPHQFRTFVFLCNNSRIINPVAKHLNLVFQYLKTRIVSRHEKPRNQNENHLQKPRICVALPQNQSLLNSLPYMNLRKATPFRTPMKPKKKKRILKPESMSQEKAGLGGGKILITGFGFLTGMPLKRLGVFPGPSSHCYTERTPSRMFSQKANLGEFGGKLPCAVLQVIVGKLVNCKFSLFASLS